jgi:hypothetical protein
VLLLLLLRRRRLLLLLPRLRLLLPLLLPLLWPLTSTPCFLRLPLLPPLLLLLLLLLLQDFQLSLAVEAVPVVLDRVVGTPRQLLRDLCPAVPNSFVRSE